jgi:hypothetical protein
MFCAPLQRRDEPFRLTHFAGEIDGQQTPAA